MVINGSDRKIFYLANDANGASRIYCSIFVDHQYAGSKEVAIEGNAKSISVIQDGSLLRMFWTESGKLYSSTSGDGVNFTSKSLVGAYEMTSFEVTRTKEAEYALRYSKTDGSSIVRAMIARK